MAQRRRNSVKSFKKLSSDDKVVSKLQENVNNVLTPIIRSPIVDGVLVEECCLKPNAINEIEHKLDRKPLGFFIVRQRKDARIWDLQDSNPEPTKSFSLATSHEVVVDIWIF